jgi:6-phospho-3-hexuloisomerase
MKINLIINKIQKELKESLKDISDKKTNKFIELILKSKNIFVAGQGRSGLISESFAMRLMQIGQKTYSVWDSTTPAISKEDLLIVISGSGKTKMVNVIIEEAKKKKANIVLITAKKTLTEKKLIKNVDFLIEINAKTKTDYNNSSIEPLGTLFEQASLIYLDAVVIVLMKKQNVGEKDLGKKHANLE